MKTYLVVIKVNTMVVYIFLIEMRCIISEV